MNKRLLGLLAAVVLLPACGGGTADAPKVITSDAEMEESSDDGGLESGGDAELSTSLGSNCQIATLAFVAVGFTGGLIGFAPEALRDSSFDGDQFERDLDNLRQYVPDEIRDDGLAWISLVGDAVSKARAGDDAGAKAIVESAKYNSLFTSVEEYLQSCE
jgi:hypothetical protein